MTNDIQDAISALEAAESRLVGINHFTGYGSPATVQKIQAAVAMLRAYTAVPDTNDWRIDHSAGQKDSERLDWLDQQSEAYGFESEHHGNRWVLDGPFKSIRAAIDTAISSQGAGHE